MTLSILLLLVVGQLQPETTTENSLNFSRDIRPILSDNCFRCHGPDEANRQGGLRLDIRASAIAPAESGSVAVKPKDVAASELVKRIFSDQPDHQMPPAESNKSLTAEEKRRLQLWIEQGAAYEEHWAFQPPVRTAVPELGADEKRAWPAWNANPIDRFLMKRLGQEKLTPNAPADKATLLRRVALDLTGLPPSLEEQRRFLSDSSPQAYEAMVDRMLTSPQYGERMAIQWLDFARYADSNGYQADGSRDIWGWRDWVIHAYNANMPFDQFTIEQLAGDMLPGATDSQIIATGFNRNHRLNGEGGRIEAEWFVETVIDRVETTGLTWLGLTLNCCRCHDHKYDPISQKEFYQLFAYFNSVEESGVLAPVGKNSENTPPLFTMKSSAHVAEIAKREAELRSLKLQIDEQVQALPGLVTQWADEMRKSKEGNASTSIWKQVPARSVKSEGGANLKRLDDGSYLPSGKNPPHDIYRVNLNVSERSVTGVLLEVFPDSSLPNQSLGRGFNGNFVMTDLEITWSSTPDQPLAIERTEADYSQDQWPASELVKNKGISPSKDRRGWAIDGNNPEKRLPRKLMIVLKEPAVPRPGEKSKDDTLVVRFGNSSTYADHNVGRFRLSIATEDKSMLQLSSQPVAAEVLEALQQPATQWSEATRKLVEAHYRAQVPGPLRKLEEELTQKQKELANYIEDIPTTMVMKEPNRARPLS